MNPTFRQTLIADTNHSIHLTLPPEMGNEVEVIVRDLAAPQTAQSAPLPPESMAVSAAVDQSGFVQDVLGSAEEECWNEL